MYQERTFCSKPPLLKDVGLEVRQRQRTAGTYRLLAKILEDSAQPTRRAMSNDQTFGSRITVPR